MHCIGFAACGSKVDFKVLEGRTSLSGVEDESLLDLDDNMNKRKGQKV